MIQSDFEHDLALLVLFHLKPLVSDADSTSSLMDLLLVWRLVMQKKIPQRPRRLIPSREVVDLYRCPDGSKVACQQLCQRAQAGQSLITYLSAYFIDTNFQDSLLDRLGIMHFHLGRPDNAAHGLPSADGPLLFARITADEFYVLGVGTRQDLTNDVLVQIIKDNWPETITGTGSGQSPTPGAIQAGASDVFMISESIEALKEIEIWARETFRDFLGSAEAAAIAPDTRTYTLRLKHIDSKSILFSVDGLASDQVPLFMLEIESPLPLLN